MKEVGGGNSKLGKGEREMAKGTQEIEAEQTVDMSSTPSTLH